MFKIMLTGLALVLLVTGSAFAGSVLVQEYTSGKANGDSLGTSADVLDAFRIPSDLSALFFCLLPDTADVLYTVEVSSDNSVWTTAFIDTCVAGVYDEHELGAVTNTAGGRVAGIGYGGMLPQMWVRLTADNLDATIDYCEIFVRYERD